MERVEDRQPPGEVVLTTVDALVATIPKREAQVRCRAPRAHSHDLIWIQSTTAHPQTTLKLIRDHLPSAQLSHLKVPPARQQCPPSPLLFFVPAWCRRPHLF
jgi:hypothetical protein